jgi:signal transduction histidine kinase
MHLDDSLADVDADPDRLRQILHNLIKNAFEAAPDSQVEISTRAGDDEGMIELEISDNGPGFPSDLVARIFEPYVTSKARGSGLGLAIVKKIVDEHGGSVTASNPPGGGARVLVTLPRVDQGLQPAGERKAV